MYILIITLMIYIYIEREIYMYMYIYIYTYRERYISTAPYSTTSWQRHTDKGHAQVQGRPRGQAEQASQIP